MVVTVAEIQVWLSTVVVTGGSLPSVVEAVLTVQVLLIVLSVSVDGLFSTCTVVTMETVNKIHNLMLDQVKKVITRNYGNLHDLFLSLQQKSFQFSAERNRYSFFLS